MPQVVLPAMRTCVKPGRQRAGDGCCVLVAALEKLYRIFERC
jgi:DNA mismatch repair protein MLH1